MEYIIFLITIQLPFCYLVWRFAKSHGLRISREIRTLNIRSDKVTHMVDTLRMSIERMAEDIYKRMKQIENKQNLIESRLNQLEKYTGLRSNKDMEDLSGSLNTLEDKDFS